MKGQIFTWLTIGMCISSQLMSVPHLTSYFNYDNGELNHTVKDFPVENRFTKQDLEKWDLKIQELGEKEPISKENYYRINTYLAQAQRDFAYLSKQFKGEVVGSIDPLSARVIALFHPGYRASISLKHYDPFTVALTAMVMEKLRKRLAYENTGVHQAAFSARETGNHGAELHYGQKVAALKPWYMATSAQFRAPEPPANDPNFWKREAAKMRGVMFDMPTSREEAVYFWAGKAGRGSGDWFSISSAYASKQNMPLEQLLMLRAEFAAAVNDSYVAAYDSKMTYNISRPSSVDSKVKPLLQDSGLPSYPSSHAATAAAARMVLNKYFPENKQHWENLAQEAVESRVWAGLDYPIDVKEGWTMGERVAELVLKENTTHASSLNPGQNF